MYLLEHTAVVIDIILQLINNYCCDIVVGGKLSKMLLTYFNSYVQPVTNAVSVYRRCVLWLQLPLILSVNTVRL